MVLSDAASGLEISEVIDHFIGAVDADTREVIVCIYGHITHNIIAC